MHRAPLKLPAGTPTAISKEDLRALPIRRYEGPVRLIAAPADLAPALEDMCG